MADAATTLPLAPYWLPFTANRSFKTAPRLFTSAEGMYYTTTHGRRVLDGTAGLWCVNAGHGRAPIVAAIREAAGRLDYATAFQVSHPDAFRLAAVVAGLMPAGLDHVFFTNSGSESVDTALKIALAYHRANGESERVRFVGRERGYHGVGFGGVSVGGIEPNRRAFAGQLLPAVDHLRHTYDHSRNAFTRGQPAHGAEAADDLDRIVHERGAGAIAAVIVEPVAGSTGVLPPPAGYLERLRTLCDRHGILLIFDEVITGFGRLGAPFAAQRFDVVPDMITMAKGLTNGAVPMGAVGVRSGVHDAIMNAAPAGIELFHGYTYSGHPLAAAAGLATLKLYDDEGLIARSRLIETAWADAIFTLRGQPHVRDLRTMGLMAGIELDPRPGAPGARAFDAFLACYERGVLVRVTADIIALSPPLIVETRHMDEITSTLAMVLRAVS